MENNRKGILLALVASILFGMSFVATKYAGVFYSSAALLGWRFLIAFGAMKILSSVGVLDVDFKGKNVWKLVRLAILVPSFIFSARSREFSARRSLKAASSSRFLRWSR